MTTSLLKITLLYLNLKKIAEKGQFLKSDIKYMKNNSFIGFNYENFTSIGRFIGKGKNFYKCELTKSGPEENRP